MLEVTGLEKIFHSRNEDEKKRLKKIEFKAVDNMNFRIDSGEVVGILGPNGAGKTTLLRMMAGILTPDAGKILVDGEDISEDMIKHKRKIGYLSGNTKLYNKLTPRELLEIFGRLYEIDRDEIKKYIDKISRLMELEGFIDKKIGELSTGQTQRVSISRCLIHNPDIYIFDEPTLGLDILSSRDIIDFMKKERDSGKTVVYSTHYMEEADSLCDRIIFILKGRIIAQGSPFEIKDMTGCTTLRESFIKLASMEDGYEI